MLSPAPVQTDRARPVIWIWFALRKLQPTIDRQLPRDEAEEDGTAATGLLALTHLQRGPRRPRG
jgi:hypothetical protein